MTKPTARQGAARYSPSLDDADTARRVGASPGALALAKWIGVDTDAEGCRVGRQAGEMIVGISLCRRNHLAIPGAGVPIITTVDTLVADQMSTLRGRSRAVKVRLIAIRAVALATLSALWRWVPVLIFHVNPRLARQVVPDPATA